MKINGGSNGPIRPDAARDERSSVSDRTSSSSATSARVDKVEISDAGRAKAAETTGATESRTERLQAIRERIFRGAYDTDEVVGEVARRILDAGHLQLISSSESK
jgi:anti-sigma28 factor (negative regulator of flagellin synthesis)